MKDFFRIKNGLKVEGQSTEPANGENGSVFYDSTRSKFRQYKDGVWKPFGEGSGEISVIEDHQDSTGWVSSNPAQITVATTTTGTDLPLTGFADTAIKITRISGTTSYIRYRFSVPAALKDQRLKLEWHQRPLAGYVDGDCRVEVYSNTLSDYTGSYVELPLTTDDLSGNTAIPNVTKKFTTHFSATTEDYYEIRIIGVSGTTALNITNVICGPGIQPQGGVIEAPQSMVLTYNGAVTTNAAATFVRAGAKIDVQGRVELTTVNASTFSIVLPNGYTIASGSNGLPNHASGFLVGHGKFITATGPVDQIPATYAVFFDGTDTNELFVTERTQSGAYVKRNANDIFTNGDIFQFEFSIPISEFAGSTVLNTAANGIEYLVNTSTSTSDDLTSFGYNPAGASIVNIASPGVTVKKRVRATGLLGSMSGKPVLKVSQDGIVWVDASTQFPYMEAGAAKYGMRPIVASGGSPNSIRDIDVEFGGDGATGTQAWSVFNTWKWRIDIEQPGVAVAYGSASATQSGMMTTGTQTLAGGKVWNDVQTWYAGSGSTLAGTYSTTGAWTLGSSASRAAPHTAYGNLIKQNQFGKKLSLLTSGKTGSYNRTQGAASISAWTTRSVPAQQWIDVAWSPELGLFAAVSETGTDRVITSPDGITWTQRTTSSDTFTKITWSPELGLFVAVAGAGASGRVMTSPDGITWTARTAAEMNAWRSITWSPEVGLFVAVAVSGTNRVMTSPDGIAWTARSVTSNNWLDVVWSPELGLFVAVADFGTVNRVMTSPDGITWTDRASADGASGQWNGIAWSPELSLFVAVGYGTNRVMTSPDGITWTARTAAEANTWDKVVWAAELGLFVAVAQNGTNRVMTSPNGITWTARSVLSSTWRGIAYSPDLGVFVAVSTAGAAITANNVGKYFADKDGGARIGSAATGNANGQKHLISGNVYSNNVTSTSGSGEFGLGNNIRFGSSNAQTGRTDSTTGGSGIYFSNLTSTTAETIGFYSNQPGDSTATNGVSIGSLAHDGTWALGRVNTALQHTVRGETLTINPGSAASADMAIKFQNASDLQGAIGVAGATDTSFAGLTLGATASGGDIVIATKAGNRYIRFYTGPAGTITQTGVLAGTGAWTFGPSSGNSTAHIMNGDGTEILTIKNTNAADNFVRVRLETNNGSMRARWVASTADAFRVDNSSGNQVFGVGDAGNAQIGPSSGTTNTTHIMYNRTTTPGNMVMDIVKPGVAQNTNGNVYLTFSPSSGSDGRIEVVAGTLTLVDVSDARIKENITPATYGLQNVMALKPITYDLKDGSYYGARGFIAQEVKAVMPDCVSVHDESEEGGFEDMHYLSTSNMIPYLVSAIQELKQQLDEAKAEISQLKSSNP